MRGFFAAAIIGGSALTALAVDAMPQFLGAALGAFVATYVRNDKKKIKVIVDSTIAAHERNCRYGPHPYS